MTSLVSCEICLEAVFLWITPLAFALSITLMILFNAVFAPSTFLFATSDSTFFERVFIILFTARFLSVNFLVCLVLFLTDLLFFGVVFAGKILSPFELTLSQRKHPPCLLTRFTVYKLYSILNNRNVVKTKCHIF